MSLSKHVQIENINRCRDHNKDKARYIYDNMCSKDVHVINAKLTKHNTGILKTIQGTHHNVTRLYYCNIPLKKSSSIFFIEG